MDTKLKFFRIIFFRLNGCLLNDCRVSCDITDSYSCVVVSSIFFLGSTSFYLKDGI